jgi:hypothetical protein
LISKNRSNHFIREKLACDKSGLESKQVYYYDKKQIWRISFIINDLDNFLQHQIKSKRSANLPEQDKLCIPNDLRFFLNLTAVRF